LSSGVFALPRGSNFRLKIVRETTTYWGCLFPSKGYDYVPGYATSKINSILTEMEIISIIFGASN
jgi:hypothetical protein